MNLDAFLQSDIPARIYQYHESIAQDWRRPHLGASIIGKDCLREIWYSFRWYKKPSFDGRMLRLFAAGNAFEDRICNELQAIGITVSRRQDRAILAPHFSGSIDGIGEGFTESKKQHLLEFKTYNQKNFDILKNKGVAIAKPEHLVQMNMYMGAPEINLDRAYYIAENKNTSEIHAERIHFDKDIFYSMKLKAAEIISSISAPDRITENPAHFACRFCDYKEICHGGQVVEKNCRTCQHSRFVDDGMECRKHGGLVPVDFQREGCYDWEC